jgi:hypothetical protein
MKLEEVSLNFPCHKYISLLSNIHSFSPYHLVPITWELRTRRSRSRRHSRF